MAQTNVQAFSGDVAISSNLAVDTNTLFVDSVGNKVGIGRTDPGASLDVNGNIIGQVIAKTRTITKGSSFSDETETFTLNPDENRIFLNNNQGNIGSTRQYYANFNAGIPTEIGTIIYLEIYSRRYQTDTTGRGHRSEIQFNGVSVLSTGYHILSQNKTYEKTLKRVIILTSSGWEDFAQLSTGDDTYVGIGTTSPKGLMHLQDKEQSSGNSLGLVISDNQGGNSSTTLPAIGFAHADGTIFRGGIQMVGESSNLEKGMIFRVGRSGSIGGFSAHPLNDVPERMRINRSGNVGIGTATPGHKLDVNGNLGVRGKMLPDNLYTHYHDTGVITFAGNTDISTSSGFVRGSTGTTGPLGTSWYLWSIQRGDGNPFERAFGYFYKYIQGSNMSASGSMSFYVLQSSGVTATSSGNNFRLITGSNSVNYPTGYVIRIVRLGLDYSNT